MDELEKDIPEEVGAEGEDAEVDPDLILGDDEETLDAEEVNPFGDKWEE